MQFYLYKGDVISQRRSDYVGFSFGQNVQEFINKRIPNNRSQNVRILYYDNALEILGNQRFWLWSKNPTKDLTFLGPKLFIRGFADFSAKL